MRAKSTDEVQTVVRACLEHGAPLVARGAGTGLSGGANAVEGSVILALNGTVTLTDRWDDLRVDRAGKDRLWGVRRCHTRGTGTRSR
ncbi:FAD-binding protein [Streptomyces sp. NEAU-W12]|uniref:FAD-binding protein n=1 Tax=Streptomyces sp. NEAU-W12 TaxID=2994668 RepID=UPI00224B4360|nr:FAD-binding protein [Streptomyces sp. NEAU-W12]MCX2928561.1 FAD-binding protein [Streptomyces sp. NEAU-W12]